MTQQPSPAPTQKPSAHIKAVNAKKYFTRAWIFIVLSLITFFIPIVGLIFSIPAVFYSIKAKQAQEITGGYVGTIVTLTFAIIIAFINLMWAFLGSTLYAPQIFYLFV